jgi:predicted O-methyltransferase YrrM
MPWDLYKEIRALHDQSKYDESLARIEETRTSTEGIRSFVACIEASCYERMGNPNSALMILEDVDRQGCNNFWVYYQLGAIYRNLGMKEASFLAFRRAHTIVGWQESDRNGYMFTHDFFGANIPSWSEWFNSVITMRPIRCLEIGSWQGGSSTWLLDKVISKRGGMLTCVDTFEGSSEHSAWLRLIGDSIQNIFDHNVTASGHSALCRKIVGRSQDVLRDLKGETFDFVYVDGAHEAKYVIQDAVLSWQLLGPDGFLLFDDIDYTFVDAPDQNTNNAIVAFKTWFASELQTVSTTNRQTLVRKSGPSSE